MMKLTSLHNTSSRLPSRQSVSIFVQHRCHIRICQNKTCKGQGSSEILKFAQDLAISKLDIVGCGCLGNCGNGPNMVLLPQEVVVSHVGTVSKMAEVLKREFEIDVSDNLITSTQLRLIGNALAREGDLGAAEEKYTQAMGLGVQHTLHMLFANRSGVRLRNGNLKGAKEDALSCIEHSPSTYTTGYLRLIDVYYLQRDFTRAIEVLEEVASKNPNFKSSQDYKMISKQLLANVKTKY